MALSKFSWTGYWLKDEEVEEEDPEEDPQPFTMWAIATTAEEARKILLDILYFTLAIMIPIDDVDKVIVRELTHQYFRNHMLYGKSESPTWEQIKQYEIKRQTFLSTHPNAPDFFNMYPSKRDLWKARVGFIGFKDPFQFSDYNINRPVLIQPTDKMDYDKTFYWLLLHDPVCEEYVQTDEPTEDEPEDVDEDEEEPFNEDC
jgi:hypothetical protein